MRLPAYDASNGESGEVFGVALQLFVTDIGLLSNGLPLVQFGIICVQQVGAFGIICIEQVGAIWRHRQYWVNITLLLSLLMSSMLLSLVGPISMKGMTG